MLFNDNTLAGDWRERVFDCADQGLSIDRATAFAVAVADLLQLPDDCRLCRLLGLLCPYQLA